MGRYTVRRDPSWFMSAGYWAAAKPAKPRLQRATVSPQSTSSIRLVQYGAEVSMANQNSWLHAIVVPLSWQVQRAQRQLLFPALAQASTATPSCSRQTLLSPVCKSGHKIFRQFRRSYFAAFLPKTCRSTRVNLLTKDRWCLSVLILKFYDCRTSHANLMYKHRGRPCFLRTRDHVVDSAAKFSTKGRVMSTQWHSQEARLSLNFRTCKGQRQILIFCSFLITM
jgi:hypothetical protein